VQKAIDLPDETDSSEEEEETKPSNNVIMLKPPQSEVEYKI
jgi:hypothetical protein